MASSSQPTDPFSGLLSSAKPPSNAIMGNEFLDLAAINSPNATHGRRIFQSTYRYVHGDWYPMDAE